jgi:broad specificity phosphatase PhoE
MVSSVYLVRHGDTAWSKSGKHTGRTEVPLSEEGERKARLLAPRLASVSFTRVLTSPRQRAQKTCELAGLGAGAVTEVELAEWDYGDYEGKTSADILKERPTWNLFRDGCPGGETPAEVTARADRLVARLRSMEGNVALFSHGHFGRVLAVRWVGLPAANGEFLLLEPASFGILSFEHGNPAAPVIALWNESPGSAGTG